MAISPNTFHIITLGCVKNLVDSSGVSKLLENHGYAQSESIRKSEFIIVNTCGFIGDARDESISTLRELASKKRNGQHLIAAGCLTQRYQQELLNQVPGMDGLMGTRNIADILEVVGQLSVRKTKQVFLDFPDYPRILNQRGIAGTVIQGGSSYLKIADGCRRSCAFCAIPLIKGPLVSRPEEDILEDAVSLQAQDVKEINLIAQDVTDYAQDLGIKDGLPRLLTKLLPQIPRVPWVRLLYTFPGSVSDRLIDLMAAENQLLPYLDIPLQHADPEVLRGMLRPADVDWVRNTVSKMRARIPELVIRTTLIVGFPNETEQRFDALMDFVRELEFDRVGVFTYSPEIGTPAEKLGDPIPEEVKEERKAKIMQLQAEISLRKNQRRIGEKIDMLVEGVEPEQQILVGRTWRDAPEIDGLVIAQGNAQIGEMVKVQITGALEHDLYARQM